MVNVTEAATPTQADNGTSQQNKHHDPRIQNAIDAVKRHNPEAKDLHVYKEVQFLKGDLYLVEFRDDGKRKEWGVYVRGDKSTVFREMEQVADYIAEHRTHLERVTDASTVTAILAIAILVVLTFLQVQGSKIDPIFTNALTLVLGFYFGQKR